MQKTLSTKIMRINVSSNELSALLKRCFEGLGYLPADYADAAATCVWMETHALNGLELLTNSWQRLADKPLLSPQIQSVSDSLITVDAQGRSLLTCGQMLAELAHPKSQDCGVRRVEVRRCHDRIAIAPGIAWITSRGFAALAHWQTENTQYYAVATNTDEIPLILSFAVAVSDRDAPNTLHISSSRSDAQIASVLSTICGTEQQPTPLVSTLSMQDSLDSSIDFGLSVNAAIWNQLNTTADAVLVTATEQSRRGAGA